MTVGAGGGAWNSVSDRNMKENFIPVNSRDILQKVLNLPISTWNYKSQDASIRHIGATAQDFKAAFGVGESDKTISTIDPDGAAFAAIQGLNEELIERTSILKTENDQLKEQLNQQQIKFADQQKQIDALKIIICATNKNAEFCRRQ